MPKRVSMKGRGADIFFGEDGQDQTAVPAPEEAAPAGPRKSAQASKDAAPVDEQAASATRKTSFPGNKETKKLVSQEIRKLGNKEPSASMSAPPAEQQFDINDKPDTKDAFVFTIAEFDAVLDLKLELRRKFELKATKNDIVRCALHHLIEDYRTHQAESVVVRRLRQKRS